ncbi:hypothetical protein VTO42DRAFT_1194 [Malbranchea cinnamomea]
MILQNIFTLFAGITAFSAAVTSASRIPELKTARLTKAYLDAFERKDLDALTNFTTEDAYFRSTLTVDGGPAPLCHVSGRPAVIKYLSDVIDGFGKIKFVDVDISVTGDGKTSFVQATGDFTSADGTPYSNSYIFRFDWKDGKNSAFIEYTNPITFCNVFAPDDCQALIDSICPH